MVGVWMYSNSRILQPASIVSRIAMSEQLSAVAATRGVNDIMAHSGVERIFYSVGATYIFVAFMLLVLVHLVLKVLIEDEFWWLVKKCRRQTTDYEHNPDYLTVLPNEVLEDICADAPAYLADASCMLDMEPEKLEDLARRCLQKRKMRASVQIEAGEGAIDLISAREMVGLHSYDLRINPRYAFIVSESATAVRQSIFKERRSNLAEMTEEDRSREIRRESLDAHAERKKSRSHSLFGKKEAAGVYKGVAQAEAEDDEVVPKGWEKHHDDVSGFNYYYNTASGETRWDAPEGTIKKGKTKKGGATQGSSKRARGKAEKMKTKKSGKPAPEEVELKSAAGTAEVVVHAKTAKRHFHM